MGNCLCVLGDSMAMPVESMLKHFRAGVRGSTWRPRASAGTSRPSSPGRRRAGRGGRGRSRLGRRWPAPRSWITFEIDGREVQAPEGAMLVDAAKHGDVEIPYFCYEPKLGPAGGRLPHVPGGDRGHPEAADLVLHAGARRHGRDHHLRPREARPERGRGVPARQPSARLPGLRQGRRVPAAGHLVRLGGRAARATSSPSATSRSRSSCRRSWRSTASAASSATAACASPRRWPRTTSSCSSSAATTPSSAPTTAAPTSGRSAATSSSSARWARSPRPRTASARGPGTSRTPARVCALCPAQCNVKLTIRDDAKVVRVLARDNAEVDDGWLCDKGRFGYQSFASPERITAPMVRDGGYLREVSWERALSDAAAALAQVRREHGGLGRRRRHQRGGLPRPAPDARGARLGWVESRAAALRRPGSRRARWPVPTWLRACPTSTTPTRSSWWAPSWWTRRRSSTCACARPCGATARGWWWRSAAPRPSTRTRRAVLRFAPGAEEAALGALAAALGSSRAAGCRRGRRRRARRPRAASGPAGPGATATPERPCARPPTCCATPATWSSSGASASSAASAGRRPWRRCWPWPPRSGSPARTSRD